MATVGIPVSRPDPSAMIDRLTQCTVTRTQHFLQLRPGPPGSDSEAGNVSDTGVTHCFELRQQEASAECVAHGAAHYGRNT